MQSFRAWQLFANPFASWGRLAWKTGEMAIASAQVIGHRTRRLAIDGPVVGDANRHEILLMGREKGEAAVAAAQAAGMQVLMLNQQFASLAFRHAVSVSIGLLSIAASRTPAESARRQSKLLRNAMTDSAVAASKLSGATAKVARGALVPVHARVRRNGKRLRKRAK